MHALLGRGLAARRPPARVVAAAGGARAPRTPTLTPLSSSPCSSSSLSSSSASSSLLPLRRGRAGGRRQVPVVALAMPARAAAPGTQLRRPPSGPSSSPSVAAAAASAAASVGSPPPPSSPPPPRPPSSSDPAPPAAFLDGGARRRHVFTFERWEMHRSSSRYFRHMSTVFRSRTFLSLSAPIALITAFAAFAGVYESVFVPEGWAPEINIGDVPLQITAFALSLLLTTRTESSNKRYEEALTVWSQVVRNESKDLARQSLYWVSSDQASVRAALVRWTAAFSRALMCHCRPGGDAMLGPATRGVLLPHESEALAAEGAGAAPAMVLQVLAELVEQADVPGIRRENMFSTLRELASSVGRCEKLIRYPLPLAWTRHTSRFLIMWLLALPFSLWEDCNWFVIPLTNLVGLLLLGIDHIGVELEDAMRAVDIEGICEDVSADVVAMLERQERVAGMLRDSGVETCASRSCGRTWALGSGGEGEEGGGGLLSLAMLASGDARRGGIAVLDVAAEDGGGLGAMSLPASIPALLSGMSWDEDDEASAAALAASYAPFGRYTRAAPPSSSSSPGEGDAQR